MSLEFAQKVIDPDAMFRLREISVEDLGKAAAKLENAGDSIAVIDRQEVGPFDYFAILSNGKVYEVTRMGFFAECTCPNFKQGHAICKHIAISLPPICRTCFKREAASLGGQCDACGPGKLLTPGIRFRCPKYHGAQPLFEVVDVNGDTAICHDMTETVNAKFPDRTNHKFSLAALDIYRSQGALQIVEQELGLES